MASAALSVLLHQPRSASAQVSETSSVADAAVVRVTPLGWVETSFNYAFTRPSNDIIHFRGFNNRHNAFTLENLVLGADWAVGPVVGRILLQVGATPSTYYLAEPALAGAGATNGSSAELWKYIQEANVGWTAPIGNGLLVQAGLFPSPIGPEVFAIKDNWNWSRSNLFFGLPFYHTGVKATYSVDEQLSAMIAVFNGWNSVVDNNRDKSFAASVTYKIPNRVLAQILYFGGVERPRGAVEGSPWRHDVDLYAMVDVTDGLALLGHLNVGAESTRFGTASWGAGALYGRIEILDELSFTLRGDRFHETVPSNASGAASPIFWGGASWVTSGTATLDFKPVDHVLLRVEYRHDRADTALFFRGSVEGDGSTSTPFLPNSRAQNTLSIGATSWF